MTGQGCPVEGCDFGEDEEKTQNQVMGHINSTNDEAHDWQALKGEVLGGSDEDTDPSEGGTDGDTNESGDGEADEGGEEGASEGGNEGATDPAEAGSTDEEQQQAIVEGAAGGEPEDGEGDDTNPEGTPEGGSDGGDGAGTALAFVAATLAIALAVLAAAGNTDDDQPDKEVIDVENQAAESQDDEPSTSPEPAW